MRQIVTRVTSEAACPDCGEQEALIVVRACAAAARCVACGRIDVGAISDPRDEPERERPGTLHTLNTRAAQRHVQFKAAT